MRSFTGHVGLVEAVAFSPDGRTLASGGADAWWRLWDVVSGKVTHSGVMPGKNPIGALAFSPDGRRLAIGDYGGRVRIDDPRSATEWEKQGRVVGLAFVPGGLAWASYQGVVRCRLPGEQSLQTLATGSPRPFCLAVSPDGYELAVGSKSAGYVLFDMRAETEMSCRSVTHGSDQGCWSVAYSPDGKSLAMALGDGAQVWDRVEGRMLMKLSGHEDVVSGVAFSPDGRRLATCSWDKTVRLYDVTAGMALVASYDWKIGRLFCVAFSPDGTLAAVGGDQNGGLVAWDVE